jgi:hypothetical protein
MIEFFERHFTKLTPLCLAYLAYNRNIPIEFFERHPTTGMRWRTALSHCKLSLDFLNRNIERLDWASVSVNDTAPLEFLEAHLDKLHWNLLCFGLTDLESWLELYYWSHQDSPLIRRKRRKVSCVRRGLISVLKFLGYGAWARLKL